MFKGILLAVIAASVAACASVPLATPEADAAAKTFAAAPDKASLYVYRDSIAKADIVRVFLGDTPLGELATNTYLFKQLPPGHYTLRVMLDYVHGEEYSGNKVELDLKAGSLAFVRTTFPLHWTSVRSLLVVVDPSEGREGVMAAELAITN